MSRFDNPGADPLSRSLFVWATWALMLVAALAFVGTYGSNVPSWDGWDMVPTMTGEQPITATWLWSQHNEHRVPVPRLILLGLCRLTGCDFRAGMYFGVLVLGALAFAMILVAKRLRGEMSYSDAFFPLVLLNWGHAANFLWGWQVQFLVSTALAGVVLLIIAQTGDRFNLGAAVIAGICLVLLPMSGANGVALVPALALWLGYTAVSRLWSDGRQSKRNSLLIFGLTMTALLLVVVYLIGFEPVPYHPSTPGVLWTLGSSIKFFTIGFGPAATALWPFSGMGVLFLVLLSMGILIIAVRRQPRERHRALGLFFFLSAMGSLALAIGSSRDGFLPRYVTLAVPTMCCTYLVYDIYSPLRLNAILRAGLFTIASIALWPNTQFGVDYGANLRDQLGSFERDMVAGVPSHMLINRYGSYLHTHQDVLIDYMPMLRRAGIGQFRFLKNDPPFREVSVPVVPIQLNQVRWEGRTAYGTGRNPYLVFDLGENRYISGVRLKYSYWNNDGTSPYVSIYWKRSDQNEFTKDHFSKYSPTGDRANWTRGTWQRLSDPETTMTVWVCDTVGQLRIHPDFKPGVFKISEILLLLPPGEKIDSQTSSACRGRSVRS